MQGCRLRPVLAAAILAAACREAAKPAAPAAATPRPIGAGILPLPAARFRPPADGILTEEQVEAFLRVRRAAKGRTDAEAASALGVPAEEIAWTRARIVEALVALDDRRVKESSAEVYARTIGVLRQARQETRDPIRARNLDEQIATLERERAGIRRVDTPAPALAANMRRVAVRRAEIETIAP